MSIRLTRRRFLVLAAAGVVASCSSGGTGSSSEGSGAAGGTATSSASGAGLSVHAGPGLRSLFDDPEAVGAVGRAVAETPGAPTGEESAAVLGSLGATRDASGAIDTSNPVAFAAAVREQVRADNDKGDVHVVAGWVLARTQAALALALAG